MVDLVGNSSAIFEFSTITKCHDMMKSLIACDYDYYKFAQDFPNEMTYLEDDDAIIILKDIPEMCEDFIKHYHKGTDTTSKFLEEIRDIYNEFKNFFCLD